MAINVKELRDSLNLLSDQEGVSDLVGILDQATKTELQVHDVANLMVQILKDNKYSPQDIAYTMNFGERLRNSIGLVDDIHAAIKWLQSEQHPDAIMGKAGLTSGNVYSIKHRYKSQTLWLTMKCSVSTSPANGEVGVGIFVFDTVPPKVHFLREDWEEILECVKDAGGYITTHWNGTGYNTGSVMINTKASPSVIGLIENYEALTEKVGVYVPADTERVVYPEGWR